MLLSENALDLATVPFQSDLASWGNTLCIAPHPDDESLGCGGTLALLKKAGMKVAVAWVSDGGLSHPNSAKYPRPKLARLREQEALSAIGKLGLDAGCGCFQRLPDGALPFSNEVGFTEAVNSVRSIIEQFEPQTLLLPWRRDPHRDHRASWAIWTQATQDLKLQRLEYLVWAFERAAAHEWPSSEEAKAFRVDISSVLTAKIAAIAAHESQTTHLIDDDPTAFWLSPEVIAHFEKPYEAWVRPYNHNLQNTEFARPEFEKELTS